MIGMFTRYLGIQIIAYGIDIGGFLLLCLLISPVPANVLSKIAAGSFAFVAHRRVTFNVHRYGGGRGQLLKYAALLAINIPVSSGLLVLFLTWVPVAALAKIVSDTICVGMTFILSRHLVFTHKHPAKSL